ncbi:MAG: pitrilysin family protein [Vicingaceae bacterium]
MINRKIQPKINPINKVNLSVPEKIKSNNLIFNLFDLTTQEVVRLTLIFPAGMDKQLQPFISSTTVSMLNKGTSSKEAFEIMETFDFYGAYINQTTQYLYSKVELYTLNKNFEKVIDLFYEVVTQPSFPEKELKIFLKNQQQKYLIMNEEVDFIARKKFNELLLKDTPFGIVANAEDYSKISREDIVQFYKNNYTINKNSFYVSGLVDDAVINSLKNTFSDINSVLKYEEQNVKSYQPKNKEREAIYINKKNAIQSAIVIGRILPAQTHEDYFDLLFLSTVLGGYFGSRLMNNIREDKGYTYGIYSQIIPIQDFSMFLIATEVGKDVTENTLKEIYKEIDILKNELIDEEELITVKNYLTGKFMRSCDGPFKMADLYIKNELADLKADHYKKYLNAINEITSEKIRSLANKYFDKNALTEVVVGDYK